MISKEKLKEQILKYFEEINEIVYEVVNAKAAGLDNKDKRAFKKKIRISKKQSNPVAET